LKKLESINGIEKITVEDNKAKILVSPEKKTVIQIIQELSKLGLKLTDFKYEEVNLESIFLQITGKSLRE
jgi:ABC-2 type transport system ATP-binding protein